MDDPTTTDREAAQKVKDAVAALNTVCTDACESGLTVEIRTWTIGTFNGIAQTKVEATISRTL